MDRKRIVIVGGGFAGLTCATSLGSVNAQITLIDRRNFHLFQPLLYQVATGGLSPANIAAPLRSVLKRQKNVEVLMAEVSSFEWTAKNVVLSDQTRIPFDILILATGSTHHYFGNDEKWQAKAPGLKSIEDATEIRRRVLSAFEQAELTDDVELRKKLLTFVVVGGGPTGIEMAGAICELSRQTMKNDFRRIDPRQARVILVENSTRILERYHEDLSASARSALEALGAEVWTQTRLLDIGDDFVVVNREGQQQQLPAQTIVWAAGVKASPLGRCLAEAIGADVELDRAGRVTVDPYCNIPGHSEVFVLGDLALQLGANGPLPGVAPVAIQQAQYVAKRIKKLLAGTIDTVPFKYWDKGQMATIGRSRAVVESGKMRMKGRLAWLAWLFIHILYLTRFENRVMVIFQWGWNYVTRNRAARLITGNSRQEAASNSASDTR
ncbi:MAG: NAD(P)/FAD-dependent oxidoreductase [Pirellulales bacterium]